MTIEDAFIQLYYNSGKILSIASEWDFKFLTSIGSRLNTPTFRLSSAQSKACLKILKKHKDAVNIPDIDKLLENPVFRTKPYPSVNFPREVRYAGDNVVIFRFKYDEKIGNALKQATRNDFTNVTFNYDYLNRVHIVRITKKNMTEIMNVILVYQFRADEETHQYLDGCLAMINIPSEFIYDPVTNNIGAHIGDNDAIGDWFTNVLGAEPL